MHNLSPRKLLGLCFAHEFAVYEAMSNLDWDGAYERLKESWEAARPEWERLAAVGHAEHNSARGSFRLTRQALESFPHGHRFENVPESGTQALCETIAPPSKV